MLKVHINIDNKRTQKHLKKFEKLNEFYQKSKDSTRSIKNIKPILEKIKKDNDSRGDFIYMILTVGSPFLTEDNYDQKPVLQSYTVFPKISPDPRLEYQNFNSGSLKNNDESYPDVISFRPKIDFKSTIVSNLAANHDVNYFNGAFNYKNTDFDVIFTNNTIKDKDKLEKIDSLIKKLTVSDNEKNKKTKIIKNENNHFVIDEEKDIEFVFNDLDIYLTTKKKGDLEVNKNKNTPPEEIKIVSDLRWYFQQFILSAKRGYHYCL
jgi:hypothetical protein